MEHGSGNRLGVFVPRDEVNKIDMASLVDAKKK